MVARARRPGRRRGLGLAWIAVADQGSFALAHLIIGYATYVFTVTGWLAYVF